MTERIIVTLLPILLGVNTPRSIDLMKGEQFNTTVLDRIAIISLKSHIITLDKIFVLSPVTSAHIFVQLF